MLAALANAIKNPSKEKESVYESYICLGLAFIIVTAFFLPLAGVAFVLLFNLFFVGMIAALVYEGNRRRDMELINSGIFWVFVFIVAKYFDFFWDLFSGVFFFFAGGIILVSSAIMLERKRKKIKDNFNI